MSRRTLPQFAAAALLALSATTAAPAQSPNPWRSGPEPTVAPMPREKNAAKVEISLTSSIPVPPLGAAPAPLMKRTDDYTLFLSWWHPADGVGAARPAVKCGPCCDLPRSVAVAQAPCPAPPVVERIAVTGRYPNAPALVAAGPLP